MEMFVGFLGVIVGALIPLVYTDNNHIIFNQYIEQKTQLIKCIEKSKSQKIDILIAEINKQKDALSLGNYAEKALNTKCDIEKSMLMREVAILVNKITGEIHKIK